MASVVAMVLTHRRPWLLGLLTEQLVKTWPEARVQFTADRPSAAVVAAMEAARAAYPNSVDIFQAPFPAVGAKENFDALRAWQYEQALEHSPKYGAIFDDDHILDEPERAREDLERTGADIASVTKIQFWDSLRTINALLPLHHSPLFFRLRAGDQFPVGVNRMIHAPVNIHDDPKAVRIDLSTPLLDIGYLWKSERDRVFAMYARVGKIDPHTRPLVEPPRLITWGGQCSYWHDRLCKALSC